MLDWRNIGFYLVTPLLVLAVFLGVNFKSDISAFIIAGDNAEQILLANEMQSGALSRRYLLSVDAESGRDVPSDFMEKLKEKLKAVRGVNHVWFPDDNTNSPDALLALYGGYGSAWYSLNPQTSLTQLFSVDGLAKRANLLKSALLSPQASLVKQVAEQDPLLLSLISFKDQGLQMQRAKNEHNPNANLILETEMSGLAVSQQQRIQKDIQSVFAAINNNNDLMTEHYRLSMTGVPVFSVATQTLIQGDIKLVSTVSVISMVMLFLWVFRSSNALIQVFGILSIVILVAILVTQLVFGYVHGMTVAIGTTLVGICIDYPIHAIAHIQMSDTDQKRIVIAKIWPSMVLGGLTTLVGYMALGASGYPGFQQVFVYAGSGILVSLLLTRYLLPSLHSTKSNLPMRVPFVVSWGKLCQRFRPQMLMGVAILFLIALVGFSSLTWMQDMQQLTPELDYLKQNDKRIRQRMTSIEPGRFVMVSAKDTESALQQSEAVYKVLDRLKQSNVLSEYYALYPWVLSKHQQQQNQMLLQDFLSPENLLHWQQALRQEGLSVEKLGHFNYPEVQAMTVDRVVSTPVKQMLDNRLLQTKDQTLVIIWLSEHQPDTVRLALAGMQGVQYFSQRDMLNTMTLDFTQRAQYLLFAGLVVIVLLLMSRYKNPVKTLQTLLPAALSAFITLGLWAVTGVSISFLHLVGFLLVVAICVDYGIFYQENRGNNISITYQAMGAAMLTSALAFASMMVSDSTALKMLSGVVVVGVVLGFLLCPILIKSENI